MDRKIMSNVVAVAVWLAISLSPLGTVTRAAPAPDPGVGDTITLSGLNGEEIAATVTRVVDPASPASEFDQPDSGDRLIGVRLKLHNVGSIGYSDAPDNGAILIDKSGQSFNPTFASISAGQSFPGAVNISPGDTRLGYVVFEAPKATEISSFQFALNSGFADETGEWSVSDAATPDEASAIDVVRSYFDAINDRDYQRAWDLGGKNFGDPYEEFAAGFADTVHDEVTIVSTSGNTVRIRLDAEQSDGSHRTYAGTMTVRDGEIVSASLHRT
jgi:hypothetical protein